MSEELSLLAAHLVILYGRDKTDDDVCPCATDVKIIIICKFQGFCTAFAILLHYFFFVCFTSFTLEAVQTNAIATGIINDGGRYSRKMNLLIAWGNFSALFLKIYLQKLVDFTND